MKETTTKYKVTMTIPHLNNRTINMNGDRNLSYNEAVWRASLYENKNPDCIFNVIEEVE